MGRGRKGRGEERRGQEKLGKKQLSLCGGSRSWEDTISLLSSFVNLKIKGQSERQQEFI